LRLSSIVMGLVGFMRWLFIVLISIGSIAAPAGANDTCRGTHAGFREYQWFDSARKRLIKVAAWYPTCEHPTPISYGPFHGHARSESEITPGRHALILISHGTGGHRFNQFYLSELLAAHDYIVLAVQHPGNCVGDDGDALLLINLWNRPKDISFALDQALREPGLADHIDPDRVGIIGHSLGGYTALVLIGAKPDIGKLDKLCGSFRGWFAGGFCEPKADELEAWREGRFHDFSHLQDSRFRSALVMAPGVPILFDKAAMGAVTVPILVFLSGRDEILKGREQAYRQYLTSATTFVELPEAGHYVYLMDCPEDVKHRAPEPCTDIGTPRAEVHPLLQKQAISFFKNVLGAPNRKMQSQSPVRRQKSALHS
jgi:predicted dienelactone hydrolase